MNTAFLCVIIILGLATLVNHFTIQSITVSQADLDGAKSVCQKDKVELKVIRLYSGGQARAICTENKSYMFYLTTPVAH